MWNYNDGKFYTNEAGNSIYYLEVNPCRCCPNSMMVERRTPLHKVNNSYTVNFSDEGSFKSLEDYIKYFKLIELK